MEGHTIGGNSLRCAHCGSDDFGEGATDLEGVGPLTDQGALRAFVCAGCGGVQLFLDRWRAAPPPETMDVSDVTEPDPILGEPDLVPTPPLVPEPPPPPIPDRPEEDLDVVREEDLAAPPPPCRSCGEPRQPDATICRSCGRLYDG